MHGEENLYFVVLQYFLTGGMQGVLFYLNCLRAGYCAYYYKDMHEIAMNSRYRSTDCLYFEDWMSEVLKFYSQLNIGDINGKKNSHCCHCIIRDPASFC